jgi:hypothetical protein
MKKIVAASLLFAASVAMADTGATQKSLQCVDYGPKLDAYVQLLRESNDRVADEHETIVKLQGELASLRKQEAATK